jgi:hypothetical protein
MITGYRILPNMYFGGERQFDGPTLPAWFVFQAPPALNVNEYAVWVNGAWTITLTPPPVFAEGAAMIAVSLSLRDFWRRFTVAEREALQNILATGTQTQKNKLSAFRDYLTTGGNVELNDDYIIASVNLMETAGILASGRAAQILAP